MAEVVPIPEHIYLRYDFRDRYFATLENGTFHIRDNDGYRRASFVGEPVAPELVPYGERILVHVPSRSCWELTTSTTKPKALPVVAAEERIEHSEHGRCKCVRCRAARDRQRMYRRYDRR